MDFVRVLDELQTIARNGLAFSKDPYERERYDRLMEIVTECYGELTGTAPKIIRELFLRELGYITPKIGAEAAIFNEQGEILLVKRSDDHSWCLPCGWMDPGESPEETAIRETFEETGLRVELTQLVGVFTRKPSAQAGPHTAVAVVYLAKIAGGEITPSHESLEVRYWNLGDVPQWHQNHRDYACAAQRCRAASGELSGVC